MTERLMDAVLVEETGPKGDWNHLVLKRVPCPSLKSHEVLVKVEACSVNRADLLQRRGLYPPPPGASQIMGLDFAGVVVEKSSPSLPCKVGDRVFGIVAGGGYGRYLTAPAAHLVPIPANLDFVQAAAAAEVFFTAFFNIFMEGRAKSGETLLVHGGGSGVGTAAIQLAKVHDIKVITTAGSPSKLERCLALGASFAINYKSEDFSTRALEFTDGSGVDLILDWIGSPYLQKHLELLKTGGRLVIIGLMGGHKAELSLAPLVTKRLRIIGSVLRTQSIEEKAALTEAFKERVLPLLEEGIVKPVIDRMYPIEQVEDAHQYLKAGDHFGKVVLVWDKRDSEGNT